MAQAKAPVAVREVTLPTRKARFAVGFDRVLFRSRGTWFFTVLHLAANREAHREDLAVRSAVARRRRRIGLQPALPCRKQAKRKKSHCGHWTFPASLLDLPCGTLELLCTPINQAVASRISDHSEPASDGRHRSSGPAPR
jgi:hypothetical protein